MEGWKVGKKFVGALGVNISQMFTEHLSMESKYAVKLSLTDLFKFNEGNVIMVAYGKCKCGLTPARFKRVVNFAIAKFMLANCIKQGCYVAQFKCIAC